MTRLPRLKAKQLIRALRRASFEVIRIRGSHHYLKHPDGRATIVPLHAGETLGLGLLKSVLEDVEMTSEQLRDLL
ncbi:MAG: type II toxin-antitoxin system HicA family toxin [Candidatus Acidiferrales bacterium]